MNDSETHAGPTNVAVILLDSLNRHMLGAYGGDGVRDAESRSVRGPIDPLRPTTSPVRCRACRRRHDILCGALDFLWKPWGSIELWEESITAALRRAGVHDDARHRSPAPVRDRRRELPHRLLRLGLRARPRGRPVEDLPRSVGDRCTRDGLRAIPSAADGGWFLRDRFGIDERPLRPPALRRHPDVVPRGGRLPRPAHHAHGGGVAATTPRGSARPLVPVRRRVRPPRTVRHAGAVGVDVRRRPTWTATSSGRRTPSAGSRPGVHRSARPATSAPTTAPSSR